MDTEHCLILFAACLGTGRMAYAEPAQAAAAQAAVSLSISTDKSVYRPRESIALSLRFANHGQRPLKLLHPDYWGVTELRIVDGAGKRVEPRVFKSERAAFQETLTLPPGQLTEVPLRQLTVYTCCHAYTFDLHKPGRYLLSVRYTSPPVESKLPASFQPEWSGVMTSDPLTIEVRNPS